MYSALYYDNISTKIHSVQISAKHTSENTDSVINPYLLKIDMYNIYIEDSSRNECVQIVCHYLNQISIIIENTFALQIFINTYV